MNLISFLKSLNTKYSITTPAIIITIFSNITFIFLIMLRCTSLFKIKLQKLIMGLKYIMKWFFKRLMNICIKFEGIFDVHTKNSYSMRKVMAGFFALLVGFLDIFYIYKSNNPFGDSFIYLIGLHFIMILLLLGIVTAEDIVKYKTDKKINGNNSDNI